MQHISFSKIDKQQFVKVLNNRVNDYFRLNKIQKTGNWKLYLKTTIMFSLLFVPYFLLLFNIVASSALASILLCVCMGMGMAGIGMNVMHDSNHGSFSSKRLVNRIFGSSIYILAGNVFNWKVQHNILHHTFTNVEGHDEDIDLDGIIRFSQHTPWKPVHKHQHWYSFLLYGLLTINWAIRTDFSRMARYINKNLKPELDANPKKEWALLYTTKIMYYLFWIALPMLLVNFSWYYILLGFFVMHYTAGMILSIIFQLAHVVDDVETVLPEEVNQSPRAWAVHQLSTTVNFATKNKMLSYLIGGLNYQIEHHIFPTISHIHYPKLAEIVKKTTSEFNLPYNEYRTFADAFTAHVKQLQKLGQNPALN